MYSLGQVMYMRVQRSLYSQIHAHAPGESLGMYVRVQRSLLWYTNPHESLRMKIYDFISSAPFFSQLKTLLPQHQTFIISRLMESVTCCAHI